VICATIQSRETKTWAAIQKWMRPFLHRHWFAITGTRLYHRDHPQKT
jgi:hypothetical protein